MMPKFQKLIEERMKKAKPMSDEDRDAKMSAVGDIGNMASKMMGDKLGGLKKVTVAAPDSEGLQKGLKVAEGVAGHLPTDESGQEDDPDAIGQDDDAAQLAGLEDESEESDGDKLSRLEQEIQELKHKLHK